MITRPRSLGQCTLRDRYPLRESGFQYALGHEVHADACHKARSLSAPLPSLAPGPRQHIPGITLGIRFLRLPFGYAQGRLLRTSLGPSLPTALAGGSLLRLCRRATVGLFHSECPFLRQLRTGLRDFRHVLSLSKERCFTPGPVRSGYHTRVDCMALTPSPFGACRLSS